jgi:hypothetical protein
MFDSMYEAAEEKRATSDEGEVNRRGTAGHVQLIALQIKFCAALVLDD